ncbi:MAG: DUF6441 family protein [Alphaproteobacteria bacterium]
MADDLRLQAAVVGDLAAFMRDEVTRAERAVGAGIAAAATGVRADLRQQVLAAGLGQKLANTWSRPKLYPPDGKSIRAAALVYSKAPMLIDAFDRGVTIRSKDGFWLAIPTANTPARGIGGKRISPATWPDMRYGKLRFVYRANGPSLLVVDGVRASFVRATGTLRGFRKASAGAVAKGRGLTTVVMFLLVPQATLRSRLDVGAVDRKWQALLPDLIVREWNRQ